MLSVASFAELRHGVERLPIVRRRERLMAWLADELHARFTGRIPAIDRSVAEAWDLIMAQGGHPGR